MLGIEANREGFDERMPGDRDQMRGLAGSEAERVRLLAGDVVRSMKSAVLFDLGGTLAHYFERDEFPAVLEEAIGEAGDYLRRKGLLRAPPEAIWRVVGEENHEAKDHRVRPLEGRLARIFQLGDAPRSDDLFRACRCFMRPIFARGRCYEDTLPVLQRLRAEGLKMAIVSNTPWGSPANLWREELVRLGLGECVDTAVFCRDVGWRKPARPIFESALDRLEALPGQCLFVGDVPQWDLAGPRAVGLEAVLIDRHGTAANRAEDPIGTLYELWDRL